MKFIKMVAVLLPLHIIYSTTINIQDLGISFLIAVNQVVLLKGLRTWSILAEEAFSSLGTPIELFSALINTENMEFTPGQNLS